MHQQLYNLNLVELSLCMCVTQRVTARPPAAPQSPQVSIVLVGGIEWLMVWVSNSTISTCWVLGKIGGSILLGFFVLSVKMYVWAWCCWFVIVIVWEQDHQQLHNLHMLGLGQYWWVVLVCVFLGVKMYVWALCWSLEFACVGGGPPATPQSPHVDMLGLWQYWWVVLVCVFYNCENDLCEKKTTSNSTISTCWV